MDLALNNLQRLIRHKTQPTNQPTVFHTFISFYSYRLIMNHINLVRNLDLAAAIAHFARESKHPRKCVLFFKKSLHTCPSWVKKNKKKNI